MPFRGPSTFTEPCNTKPCSFPKKSCCTGYTAKPIGTTVACVGPPAPTLVTETCTTSNDSPICCPTGGMWSDWGPRVNCNETCGAFGTALRLRTCLTAKDGCACTGPASKTVPCAFQPCTFPRKSCVTGFHPIRNADGNIRCVALIPPLMDVVQKANCCPPGGVWAEWTAWSKCPTDCGSCSTVTRIRKCGSRRYGCPCKNNALQVMQKKYCNVQPCKAPKDACCVPFKAKTVVGVVRCA